MKKRGPGRPKGSKNKPGHKAGRPRKLSNVLARIRALDESEFRRLRGRPRKSEQHAEKVALHSIPNRAGHKKVIFVGYMKTK